MKKLTIIQSVLLFLFGLICLFTIETCYHDYIYSEQKVVLRLSDEFEEKSQEYMAFFDYAQKLKKSINWDSLEIRLKEVKYETEQEIHINFNLYPDEGGGIGYDGLRGVIVSLPDMKIPIEKDIIFESIKNDIGLSISKLDTLRNHLDNIKEGDIYLFKDGSVIIKKFIGPEIFDMEEYQIVRTGERMFLYGNYRNMLRGNIFIGKKN